MGQYSTANLHTASKVISFVKKRLTMSDISRAGSALWFRREWGRRGVFVGHGGFTHNCPREIVFIASHSSFQMSSSTRRHPSNDPLAKRKIPSWERSRINQNNHMFTQCLCAYYLDHVTNDDTSNTAIWFSKLTCIYMYIHMKFCEKYPVYVHEPKFDTQLQENI